MEVEANSCLSRSNALLAFSVQWKGVPDLLVKVERGSAMELKPRINLL